MVEFESDPDRTLVEAADPLVSTVLGNRYRLDFQLACGGFGAVYRATDLLANTEVAIKVLHRDHLRARELVARFRREAETLARLSDPHTVTAFGHGETADGVPWIAMELLAGESLYERFAADGRLPWSMVVAIAREVCSSLAEAHALGIVHRDLKPANIHLERRGDAFNYVKVIDFGIAKVMHEAAPGDVELTQTGQVIGTFDYMSPEQLVAGACTPASDVYTLGVVIYEMIAGARPFPEARGPASLLAAVLDDEAPPLLSTHAEVPAELAALVARCLARDAGERFATAAELGKALDGVACDNCDDEITQVVIMPRFPVPMPPPPVFEVRGTNAKLAPLPRAPEPRARWVAWAVLAATVSAVAAAIAAQLVG